MIAPTKVFPRLVAAMPNHKIIVAYGGSSSSKTISILQILTLKALYAPGTVITIVGETMPMLRKSVIRDWLRIVMPQVASGTGFYNKSEFTWYGANGSIIQFVSADEESKFHAMRQDYTYIDEVIHVSKGVYKQLLIRTRKNVFLSFNPKHEFWLKSIMDRPDVFVDHSTYDDNEFLEQDIIDTLEDQINDDENFYNVYRLGLWGAMEGLVFTEGKHWQVTYDWPDDYRWRCYGLDFGYSNHPSALLELRYYDREVYVRTLLYETKLTNQDIGVRMTESGVGGLITADSAEPKSIQELQRMGFQVIPSVKGPDSIKNGIQQMKSIMWNVHVDSTELIKELRNYRWRKNKDGIYLNQPVDSFNHAIDGIRYAYKTQMSEMSGGISGAIAI